MKQEITVYIASPYTHGWMPANVRRQIDMAHKLFDLGYYPHVPLMAHFLEMYAHRSEADWLNWDFVFLKKCDALLRLKPVDDNGIEIPSSGSDKEVQVAIDNGIPVFYSLDELNNHFKSDPNVPYTQGTLD